MLPIPEEQRRHSLGRRASYWEDITAPRARPPPLDPVTLAARQQYAARGIVEIMRRKVAKRRRVLREQTSVMSEVGDAVEENSSAVNITTTDEDDINKAPQTMNNYYIISAIPYMPKSLAAVCLVLNVVLPGSGDLRSACLYLCLSVCRSHISHKQELRKC